MPIVDERVGRHDLDRSDAEPCQMFNRSRMSEPREGAAGDFGDRRIEPREASQVELVDDERLGRDALMSRLTLGRRSGDRPRRVAAGVFAELEHGRMKAERTVKPPGVWVG